jgi:Flp pilus assembly pilin Flp
MRFTRMRKSFLKDTAGVDLVEYVLLLAFLAAFSGALFIGAGDSISGLWHTSNSQLATAANSVVTSGTSSGVASAPVPPPSDGSRP